MNKHYNVITGIIIVLLFIGSIAGIFIFYTNNESADFEYLKDYKDNEYMPVYISEEKMAKMYYNEFMYYLNNDLNGAYNLLNAEYRKKKFPLFMTFQVYTLPYFTSTLESYSVVERNDKRIFYLKLSDGNEIIFSTTGVMKYELYFDENTISIE